ncbi:hypothetical protein [Candidatus Neptunichlamydia sp. REUL1]|uniref:hypothetical protein n=1 Tax=Candidatus Neptunichlamydia sp. REUL1 TaxID=3064277 RepID=UPI00292F8377|nr:hypothetical protein [Candidatus Neptunochlamydia sp. REUL1]
MTFLAQNGISSWNTEAQEELEKDKDLMLQLTELNSIDRPSPKEALRHRFFSL